MINRDELSHVRLYQKLFQEAMQVFPHSREQMYEMFAIAVEHECKMLPEGKTNCQIQSYLALGYFLSNAKGK
ncbi:hypothetical protein [Nostoc sp.]|uniref:hypothetical protein n=1 Tax=Nostoc sp. TaxID=1180 RepID=UPI002FF5E3DB